MGWWSGSSREYDEAHFESIDPRKVRWANTPVDRKAVEHYKRNPSRPYGGRGNNDGDPLVIRKANGQLVGWNGKHRGTAAAETGRRLRARVYDEPAGKRRGFWG